jgi:hypothetical protein
VNKSGGGILLVDADGESIDNEGVLARFREQGVDEVVLSHTEMVWAECAAWAGSPKDELSLGIVLCTDMSLVRWNIQSYLRIVFRMAAQKLHEDTIMRDITARII